MLNWKKIIQIICLFICGLCLVTLVFAQEPVANDSQLENGNGNGAELLAEPAAPSDPLEKYNRIMFHINDNLDRYIMKPAAELYNKIIPRPLNLGIDNFYHNALGVQLVLNDLFQANFYQATRDTWRFLMDTTVGAGGLFDIGQRIGLEYQPNDFGLTLAKWGYENSSFFVIPVLGPSTIRDTLSMPVNYFSDPTVYFADVEVRNSITGVYFLDKRAQLLRFQNVYEEMAIDPYIFQRNAYLQRRAYLVGRLKELDNPYTTQNTQALRRDYYINE